MTNHEIITKTAIALGIFSPEFIEKCLASGYEVPLHTYKGWLDRGYQVQKGAKAYKITIWNYRKKTMKCEVTDTETGEITTEDIESGNYYQKEAYFFTPDQVKKVV